MLNLLRSTSAASRTYERHPGRHIGESWLRDEEQGDSCHAATELLDLLEPRRAENSAKPSQRERRLSSEWREAMAARARQRFHAKPQAASANKPSGA